MKENEKSDIEIANNQFLAYQMYSKQALNDIAEVIKNIFNFEVKENDGLLGFKMNDCDYDVYLTRGYIICAKSEAELSEENVWCLQDVKEFIDLIKDLSDCSLEAKK